MSKVNITNNYIVITSVCNASKSICVVIEEILRNDLCHLNHKHVKCTDSINDDKHTQ